MADDDEDEEVGLCMAARDASDWLSCLCQLVEDHDGDHSCMCGKGFS